MKEVKLEELKMNPFTLFAKNWAALCSGDKTDGFNAMTIAWGEAGALWERESHSNRLPVVTVYVRPSRYSKHLMDKDNLFSVSFMPDDYKRALGYLGSHHGYDDKDKIRNAGLTAVPDNGTVYIGEADLVFICRKLYQQDLTQKGFIDDGLYPFNYPDGDVHTMYVGEIIKVLERD